MCTQGKQACGHKDADGHVECIIVYTRTHCMKALFPGCPLALRRCWLYSITSYTHSTTTDIHFCHQTVWETHARTVWVFSRKCKEKESIFTWTLFNFVDRRLYGKPNHYGFSVCMLPVGMDAGSYDDFVTAVCQRLNRWRMYSPS